MVKVPRPSLISPALVALLVLTPMPARAGEGPWQPTMAPNETGRTVRFVSQGVSLAGPVSDEQVAAALAAGETCWGGSVQMTSTTYLGTLRFRAWHDLQWCGRNGLITAITLGNGNTGCQRYQQGVGWVFQTCSTGGGRTGLANSLPIKRSWTFCFWISLTSCAPQSGFTDSVVL